MTVESTKGVILILHNLRSTHNVGSIFRTSDAVGVKKIYCVGTTPAPVDRFGRERKDIAKVALGAEKTIEWEYTESLGGVVDDLKNKGFLVVGVEQDEGAIDYRDDLRVESIALIVGSEPEGLSVQDRALCDMLIEIPMVGKKESLNVSVATGIVLYEVASLPQLKRG